MCRKKYDPHKCEYVPLNEAMDFILKIPAAFEKVHNLKIKYREALRSGRKYQWRIAGREYRQGPEAKIITSILQLRYRYTDSYLKTGDALNRFVCIYEEHRDQIQARGQGNNS